ncbi:LAQU0S25e00254g1_1 [Lachancea quebecensis]|uniref:tRNA-splicing endonuclease subunit Sen2 n=1 Tax=Lachancea quebecensis TaxID=1654605 RepID=A0A0P1KYA9_9SACH|nr:LAQU0S25e00254g1_1 [Lachancea quebecensis]
MPKYVPNAKRYKYPLPIHPLDQLPAIKPYNPISWVYWLYCYTFSTNQLASKIHAEFTNGKHLTVTGPEDMRYLWENGFFGTAQLSRSEPTWKKRTMVRLGLSEGSTALEHITEKRRTERLKFKQERSRFEAIKLDMRQRGIAEDQILAEERAFLKSLREMEKVFEEEGDVHLREVDEELFGPDEQLMDMEVLELMPVEGIFLTFALPVLDITVEKLLENLTGGEPSYADIHELCLKYVAYHHYRSHGWCARSGIKFGCDFLLYRRGPPFQHADYGVKVLEACKPFDTTLFSGAARVLSGARKPFILCYVELQKPESEVLEFWRQGRLDKVFCSYKVGEASYRRWVPGKNRD